MIYAHTFENSPEDEWEPLFTPHGAKFGECQKASCDACRILEARHGHLNKVAYAAGRFAAEMFSDKSEQAKRAQEWGNFAGLWHDLGKFAPEWQMYLKKKFSEVHSDELTGKMDHSTAGAVYSSRFPPLGELMAYLIAGHHSGLPDGPQLFEERLKKTLPDWEPEARASGLLKSKNLPMPPLDRSDAGNDGMAFMLRFFYSCLVDADFLVTESFMQPDRAAERKTWPADTLDCMLKALEEHLAAKFESTTGVVNQAREGVRRACAEAAENQPGFFSLTVPTGGGKTLSSLLFALRHARKHGLRRVIYVIPFTSIITQNAEVFRTVFSELSKDFGRELVLEHHSKFDPATETTQSRLAAENWDAPLIVTTNVQFFESLYANRSSACRKLHRIAKSVIIFDEVQSLPFDLLAPILRGLRCLVKDFYSSAVLCTATQPALKKRTDFTIGIPDDEITEIIANRDALFQILRRTTSYNLGKTDDASLIKHVRTRAEQGGLVIVNTTKAAQILYRKLSEVTTAMHLSARMCPAHVLSVLEKAKHLRLLGKPLVLVSTQIIEAGVDISFPVVYRAECGIDSFAQAAGRCNRNGELVDKNGSLRHGEVFLFQPLDHPIPYGLSDLKVSAEVTRDHIVPNFLESDLLSLEAIQKYFEQAIWQAGPRTDDWDKHHIVSGDMCCFPRKGIRIYQFKTAAERFKLIPVETHPILVPWGSAGMALADELRRLSSLKVPPLRRHYRSAQQFSVQVYEHEWKTIQNRLEILCDGTFPLLIHPENDYDPETGLKRTSEVDDPSAFIL